MLKYQETEVVFAEIPDRITLAINIANCPIHCPGCHSKWLWKDEGTELNEESLKKLIDNNKGIDCVAFMGGDNDPQAISHLCEYINTLQSGDSKHIYTAWYSGRDDFYKGVNYEYIDYVKIGKYIESRGPLYKNTTNQVLYKKNDKGIYCDITNKFWEKEELTTAETTA